MLWWRKDFFFLNPLLQVIDIHSIQWGHFRKKTQHIKLILFFLIFDWDSVWQYYYNAKHFEQKWWSGRASPSSAWRLWVLIAKTLSSINKNTQNIFQLCEHLIFPHPSHLDWTDPGKFQRPIAEAKGGRKNHLVVMIIVTINL